MKSNTAYNIQQQEILKILGSSGIESDVDNEKSLDNNQEQPSMQSENSGFEVRQLYFEFEFDLYINNDYLYLYFTSQLKVVFLIIIILVSS